MESHSVATFVPTQFLQCNSKGQACVLKCKICVSVYVGGAEEEGLYSVIMENKSSSSSQEGCAFLCACLCRCLCLFLVRLMPICIFFLFRPVSRAPCSLVLGSLHLF